MEGELAAALEPVEVGTELDAISLEAEVGGEFGGSREEPYGAHAVVAGEVGGDRDGGAAVQVVRELDGTVSGVREELAYAEQGVERPARLVNLKRDSKKK